MECMNLLRTACPGLSIASDIARRLQGQLTLKNAVTGGLVATLALPR